MTVFGRAVAPSARFFMGAEKPHANPEEQKEGGRRSKNKDRETETKADPPPAAKDDN
jgi:hypothetical protein